MLFYIAAAVLLASAEAKFYTDCGSTLATIEKVAVSGCAENAKECVLKRNTNISISIDFTPSTDVKSLETEVHGVIMNLPVPFPPTAARRLQGQWSHMSTQGWTKVSYMATLPVLKSYPRVKVDVKWELKNDDDQDLVCILIPAKIN